MACANCLGVYGHKQYTQVGRLIKSVIMLNAERYTHTFTIVCRACVPCRVMESGAVRTHFIHQPKNACTLTQTPDNWDDQNNAFLITHACVYVVRVLHHHHASLLRRISYIIAPKITLAQCASHRINVNIPIAAHSNSH